METKSFVRKPFNVKAVQATQDNLDEIAAWCKGEVRTRVVGLGEEKEHVKYVKVPVVRPLSPRQTRAYLGDWVLLHDNGTWKVFTDTAMEKCFEENVDHHVVGQAEFAI